MRRNLLMAFLVCTGLIACDLPTVGRSASPPALDFFYPAIWWDSTWTTMTTSTGTVRIKGDARDSTGVASVAYRIAGGPLVPMRLEQVDPYLVTFDEVIPIRDGIHPLVIIAVDEQGNQSDPVEFTVRATSASLEVQPLVTIDAQEGEDGWIDRMRVVGATEGLERLRYELIMWIDGPGSVNYSSPIELATDGSFATDVETRASPWNQISIVGEDALGIPVSVGWRDYSLIYSAPGVEIQPAPADRAVDPETGRVDLALSVDGHANEVASLEVRVDDGAWEPIDIPEDRSSVRVSWSPVLTRDTSELAVRAVSTGGGTRIVRFRIPAS